MLRQKERQLRGHVLDLCCFAQEVTHVTSVHRPLTSTTQLQGREEGVRADRKCRATSRMFGDHCYLCHGTAIYPHFTDRKTKR